MNAFTFVLVWPSVYPCCEVGKDEGDGDSKGMSSLSCVEWGCRTPARGGGHGRGTVGGLGLLEVRLKVGEGLCHGRVRPQRWGWGVLKEGGYNGIIEINGRVDEQRPIPCTHEWNMFVFALAREA